MYRSWSPEWQELYRNVHNQVDLVRNICPSYHRACFRLQNEWMASHNVNVIAVYKGQSSKTQSAIDYAHQHSVSIDEVNGKMLACKPDL